jgi:hypothetical protein
LTINPFIERDMLAAPRAEQVRAREVLLLQALLEREELERFIAGQRIAATQTVSLR